MRAIPWRCVFWALALGCVIGPGCGAEVRCLIDGQRYAKGDSFPAADGCNTCVCGDEGKVSCSQKACPVTCGGPERKPCPAGWMCVFAAGACGQTDAIGSCREIASCRAETSPVCDCDGVEQTSPCQAKDGRFHLAGGCPSCVANGKTYKSGARFPAPDGCNECRCNSGEISCTQKSCRSACLQDGKRYQDGETFAGTDSCEMCFCDDGKVACHRVVCHKPCVDDETKKTYQPGESFETSDGCKKCVCGPTGLLFCESQGCKECVFMGKTYRSGSTFPATDSCNTCSCKDGQITCTQDDCETRCGQGEPSCPSGMICIYTIDGTCQLTRGLCRPKQTCDEESRPVCGCNGTTYTNPCSAQQSSQKIAYYGACQANKPCGTKTTGSCASGELCDQPAHCGKGGEAGVCRPRPGACPEEDKPVCGCDQVTYQNACKAAQAGSSIAFPGACP